MKIYIVDGTPVLDGTPKELAQYQRMAQQLAVYDAYQNCSSYRRWKATRRAA